MFCKYCGTMIAADSVFCQKCGKRLDPNPNSFAEVAIRRLRLKTPYPYFVGLVLGFALWTVWPHGNGVDYAKIKWSIERGKVLDVPTDNLFQESMSLVVENTGSTPVREIPIDLVARIEPQKSADIVAGFLGKSLYIMRGGRALPLTVVLSDPIEPGAKRRFSLEGSVTALPPFKVTLEVRQEDRPDKLTTVVLER